MISLQRKMDLPKATNAIDPVQFLVSFIPARTLKRIFPATVTGVLLLVLGIYLVTTAGEAWGGGASCQNGQGIYALCPNTNAPKPLPWGHPQFIGIGFSVFATILIVEMIGSPLMKSASIILGLAVGSTISGATGFWTDTQIRQAPTVTFLWVETFRLRVDGSLILPLMILFVCEVSARPEKKQSVAYSDLDVPGHGLYAMHCSHYRGIRPRY